MNKQDQLKVIDRVIAIYDEYYPETFDCSYLVNGLCDTIDDEFDKIEMFGYNNGDLTHFIMPKECEYSRDVWWWDVKDLKSRKAYLKKLRDKTEADPSL